MFALALKLGKTVAELKASMSSSELTEWAAFFAPEPEQKQPELSLEDEIAMMKEALGG